MSRRGADLVGVRRGSTRLATATLAVGAAVAVLGAQLGCSTQSHETAPPLTPVVAPVTAATAAFATSVSPNGRYLLDQHQNPYMLIGDSPWSLFVNRTEAQAEAYFADRHARGFNAALVAVICNDNTGGRTNSSTYDGIVPFTTPGDLSTPNPAYWQRVDAMVRLAENNGITLLVDPIETSGSAYRDMLVSNGVTKDYEYGAFLGSRYAKYPNIIWANGNDYLQADWKIDPFVTAVANGIRSTDPGRIQTVELNYLRSTSFNDPNWTTYHDASHAQVDLDWAYTYYPTYDEVLDGYNTRPARPVFMGEANYEGENLQGHTTDETLLRQAYWTMTSGATGLLYGKHQNWASGVSWSKEEAGLDSTAVIELGDMRTLLSALPWFDLIPDQGHTLLTAGYGNYSSGGHVLDNAYVTAARTEDGSVGIVYMPTRRTITINMSVFSGPVTARWFDPTNGTYTPAAASPLANTGSRQFTPSHKNSKNGGDWVLLLTA